MNVLSRRSVSIRVITVIMLILIASMITYRSLNPTDLNKIVVMFENPDDFRPISTMEFFGDIYWKQTISMPSSIGPKKATTVHVGDVRRAWFDGTVTLKDIKGDAIASVPISPHQRYGGTLVIFVDADGKSFAAWNQVPVAHP